MDQQMDGWTESHAFLPRSTPFSWDPGLGSELPVVVIKPLTRRPPRFAAMTFNTSGMIGYLRTRGARLCWAPVCGSWAPPPEGVPARVGGAGGAVGPDRQAGSPGGGGASRMAQQWARGEASRTGGSTRSAGQAGGRAEERRGQRLREAGAARPPARGPEAAVAAAAAPQAVVVVHVTAAAHTVQLAGAKLHALDVHFCGERTGRVSAGPPKGPPLPLALGAPGLASSSRPWGHTSSKRCPTPRLPAGQPPTPRPTLLRVIGGDCGARAVGAHALQALCRQLLQAPLQEAMLPLQLLLDAQRPPILLLQFLVGGGTEL